jgi:hypothetical protein
MFERIDVNGVQPRAPLGRHRALVSLGGSSVGLLQALQALD